MSAGQHTAPEFVGTQHLGMAGAGGGSVLLPGSGSISKSRAVLS